MDLFEKINRSFGTWYEGLFGGSNDVRPKDILRRILSAMEDYRKEGIDNRIYVPNQYILEIDVHDAEEKEYLLAFLDKDELEAAIRRYCQQNHYHIRGALDFTVTEVDSSALEGDGRREKVRVRCRYDASQASASRQNADKPAIGHLPEAESEEHTVASFTMTGEEEGTVPSVASAALVVYAPDRPPFRFPIARGAITIGRSAQAGNELVVESDGQVSKRHARIELDSDGRFTIYDLGSTNGVKVNGRRAENRTLNSGDEITLGATRMIFQQEMPSAERVVESAPLAGRRSQGTYGGAAALRQNDPLGSSTPPARLLGARTARLILMEANQDIDDFLLGSETSIGRGVTNDIVLTDRSVGTRHARILWDGGRFLIESLGAGEGTLLNEEPVVPNQAAALSDGDILGFGAVTMRFESGI